MSALVFCVRSDYNKVQHLQLFIIVLKCALFLYVRTIYLLLRNYDGNHSRKYSLELSCVYLEAIIYLFCQISEPEWI